MAKTVEWAYPETGSQVVYLACCPWFDLDGEGAISRDVWSLHSDGVTIKSLLSRIDKEGSIDTSGVGVNIFTTWLQNALKHPVINEFAVPAGLAASFHFSWKNGGVHGLQAAVKDQLGLQLAQGQRSLEFLVIDHAERLAPAGSRSAAGPAGK
jgi:hypothetical protein